MRGKFEGGIYMALERNRPATNPNHRPMSVHNMEHDIVKINEEALRKLSEIERKRKWFWLFKDK
jgi:hypothetical protein